MQHNDLNELTKIPDFSPALEQKVDIDPTDKTTLVEAVRNNDIESLESLIAAGADLNSQNNDGDTALILAARLLNIKALQILIEAKANLDLQNSKGETALMTTTESHKDSEEVIFDEEFTIAGVKIVEMLLEAKADTTLRNTDGVTALNLAEAFAKDPKRDSDYTDLIQLLSVPTQMKDELIDMQPLEVVSGTLQVAPTRQPEWKNQKVEDVNIQNHIHTIVWNKEIKDKKGINKGNEKFLLLDVDGTLLDLAASTQQNKLALLHEKHFKQVILLAKTNGVRIGLVTARGYRSQVLAPSFISIPSLLKEIDPNGETVEFVIYTSLATKEKALRYLQNKFATNNLMLVDDCDVQLAAVRREKFVAVNIKVIPVDKAFKEMTLFVSHPVTNSLVDSSSFPYNPTLVGSFKQRSVTDSAGISVKKTPRAGF